jgi:ATP-dependent Clp protease adaptor protein ClpS
MGLFGTQHNEDVEVLEKIDTDTRDSQKIILYNDDHNSFDHVIACLVSYCGHTFDQAEQCAFIVHNRGKCSVKEGDEAKLRPIKEALCDNGLSAEIE